MQAIHTDLNPIVQQQVNQQAKSRMFNIVMLAIALLLILGPLSAFAQTAGGSMPWETFTQKVACSMSGPWVKWLAVIAIALGGIMFGLGELSGPFKRTMEIAGGFSIAVGAVTVVTMLLPSGATAGLASSACGI